MFYLFDYYSLLNFFAGSPLHQSNIEGTALSLSQLQLHPGSSPGSPLTPQRYPSSPPRSASPQQRCLSPQSSLSPQPSSSISSLSPQPLSPSHSSGNLLGAPMISTRAGGPSPPPPLQLDSIREEPARKSKSSSSTFRRSNSSNYSTCTTATIGQNPQISVTSDTGDQIILASSSSDSSPDPCDEMDTSPFQSPLSPEPSGTFLPPMIHLSSPRRLLKGYTLDCPYSYLSHYDSQSRPSITRGTPGIFLTRPQTGLDTGNNNIHRARNEHNLVRQDAINLEDISDTSKREMFISNLDFRHSFPPYNTGLCTDNNDSEMIDMSTINKTLHHQATIENLSQQHRDILFDMTLEKTGSGSLLLGVPNKWSSLPVQELVNAIIREVEVRAPFLVKEGIRDTGMSVRDQTGAQVELEVSQGPANNCRALKMRRVSGDDLQYTQICKQLIDCMTT